ncbi:MAG: tetratricopeptide repeat protein, partial [bacterium]
VGGLPDPAVREVVSRLQRAGPVKKTPVPESAADERPHHDTVETAIATAVSASVGETRSTARTRVRPMWRTVAIVALILVAVASYRAWPRNRHSLADGSACRFVAVLPFANTSGDAANEPFSDGLTDELIGTLGKVPKLTVAGRTTAFALKGKGLGVHALADSLGVCAVLEGSVRREGRRLKATAQLVRTSNATVMWADSYDRELVAALSTQEEIARSIVDAIRVALAVGAGSPSLRRSTADPVAYELYLRGRSIFWQRTGRDGILQAASYFDRAIARDSLYARAYAGLSDAHTRLAVFGYGRPHEEFAKAKAAAQKALALDSTLADAHASLAHLLCVHDYNWAAAELEARIAVALDPGYGFARIALAICLSSQGRLTEATAHLDTAHVADPLAPGPTLLLGRAYVNQGRPDQAIRCLKGVLELNPLSDLSYQQLGHAYLQKNMYPQAIAALRRAAELSGARDSAELAYAYAVAGRRLEAKRIIQSLLRQPELRYTVPFHIAMAYTGLGDIDEAFKWLDQGYESRASFMNGIKSERAFRPLHRDARWPRLLEQMGLRPQSAG